MLAWSAFFRQVHLTYCIPESGEALLHSLDRMNPNFGDKDASGKIGRATRSRLLLVVVCTAAAVAFLFRSHIGAAFQGNKASGNDLLLEKVQALDTLVRNVAPLIKLPKRHKRLCGYSDEEVLEIWQQPHGSRIGENRYYHPAGGWMNLNELGVIVKKTRGKSTEATPTPLPDVVCTIASIFGQLPCEFEVCLMQINWRPSATDWWVMNQLLEKDEYAIFKGRGPPPRSILDGGANFGLGTLILATMYPDAKIVTVEPSERNYKMVTLNTQDHPNVVRIKAGLWWRVARLALTDGQRTTWGKEWGYMVDEAENIPKEKRIETLTGVSIPFLCDVLNIPWFDYMKIDIEGSEKEVFTARPKEGYGLKFVEKLQVIAVETHSDMREGSKEAVELAFQNRPHFEQSTVGEYLIWTRKGGGEKSVQQKNIKLPTPTK